MIEIRGRQVRQRIVMGLAGAPTVVVDVSIQACREALGDEFEVFGLRGGPTGLVTGDLVPIDMVGLTLNPRGGSALSGGRKVMTLADIATTVEGLASAGIDVLILAGGNGTMTLLSEIAREARRSSVPLRVIGIPKTVDNDLQGVDFSPGYASSAHFLGMAVAALAADHRAMKSVEAIRVVETIGRDSGWLAVAAATLLAREHGIVADLCLVPESGAIRERALIAGVDRALQRGGQAFIICSEGIDFGASASQYQMRNHSQLLLGGVARRMAGFLQTALGVASRGEALGMLQRSAYFAASETDRQCAIYVGEQAARYCEAGLDSVMVGFKRVGNSPLRVRFSPVALAEVANVTRRLPSHFRPESADYQDRFYDWLAPIASDCKLLTAE